MNKTFPIDFVRQFIEQSLYEEHIYKNSNYFGGTNQVSLFSFYEQLQKEEEVNRYVEIYNDLVNQQNRSGIIMNGTIIAPENPTITNVNQCLIIPMSFTCTFRVTLENRDNAIDTINNLISIYKGRHVDIAEFDNGKLFKVGTIANNVDGRPQIKCGDYLGKITNLLNVNTEVSTIISNLTNASTYNCTQVSSGDGVDQPEYWYYVSYTSSGKEKLCVVYMDDGGTYKVLEDDHTHFQNVIYPPEHESFTKYKLSVSFDSIRCDEPRNLNAKEYCVIAFGGSATLVSQNVFLGNDLTKVAISKSKIVAQTDISINGSKYWLEPLELPSGSNADTQINQLISNNFVNNTHTDALSLSMQYTFILDKSVDLLKQWFNYARYGTQADGTTITYANGITPNMIYEISEIWSYWGNVELNVFKAKIIESIDIENTESDTLTITIPFQLQGENN